jgi:hypothetical protein
MHARADPALEERSDVLALLLRACDDNGKPIPDRHIAEELRTWLMSGHGTELRQAAILEVQRTRPVIDTPTPHQIRIRLEAGSFHRTPRCWPANEQSFPPAASFDPTDSSCQLQARRLFPFGGGVTAVPGRRSPVCAHSRFNN